jgi:hypothetical protein
MPWIVGIDEAGYGPNLGPLVMTSVACRVPDHFVGADLWQVLAGAVRRAEEEPDGRIVIEDSKLVYSPAKGLRDLEAGVLAALSPWCARSATILSQFIDWVSPSAHDDLRQEAWYTGTARLPVQIDGAEFETYASRFETTCRDQGLSWGKVQSVVICAPRFNRLLKEWCSKGAVLGVALAELLASNCQRNGDAEPLFIFIDKHGGRNTYAPMVQHALPDGFVVVHEENHTRSLYSVLGLQRETRLRFQPRADAEHFCVALASMVSKYLRELLMGEFNRFWSDHVPGIAPTAGYPGDSRRFFTEIKPAAKRLGIPPSALWRRR